MLVIRLTTCLRCILVGPLSIEMKEDSLTPQDHIEDSRVWIIKEAWRKQTKTGYQIPINIWYPGDLGLGNNNWQRIDD